MHAAEAERPASGKRDHDHLAGACGTMLLRDALDQSSRRGSTNA